MSLYIYDPRAAGTTNIDFFGKRKLVFHNKRELTKFISRRRRRTSYSSDSNGDIKNKEIESLTTALHKGWNATLTYVRMSARKLRLVSNTVKGKYISEADRILSLSNKRAADIIKRVLKSAVSSAVASDKNPDDLRVVSIIVEAGPTIKRVRFKDRGRVHPIMKRTSHLKVLVN